MATLSRKCLHQENQPNYPPHHHHLHHRHHLLKSHLAFIIQNYHHHHHHLNDKQQMACHIRSSLFWTFPPLFPFCSCFLSTTWSDAMMKLRSSIVLISVLLIAMMLPTGMCIDLEQCRSSLGMQSLDIKDTSLSASSSLDPHQNGPECARIRTEMKGGAWCPQEPISNSSHEYLEVDLEELKVITLVETQGRFGQGQGQEYVEQYMLEYQRVDRGRWFRYKNRNGQEFFHGNTNTHVAELREVDPVIIGRRVRFVPRSLQTKNVCLRVEVYGCKWEDGLVSYDVAQGERRSSDVLLTDLTYDGYLENGMAYGGLGQLTDGIEGHSSFRSDPLGTGVKGYDWVGWKGVAVSEEVGSLSAKKPAKREAELNDKGRLKFETVSLSRLIDNSTAGLESKAFWSVGGIMKAENELKSMSKRNYKDVSTRLNRYQKSDRLISGQMSKKKPLNYNDYNRDRIADDQERLSGSQSASQLRIVFNFDTLRNFSYLQLHVNNQHLKDTRIFTKSKVYFGSGGSESALEFNHQPDLASDQARWVKIPLMFGVAKQLRLHLTFGARWLMISEVQFFSVPVKNAGALVNKHDDMMGNSPNSHLNHDFKSPRRKEDDDTDDNFGDKSDGDSYDDRSDGDTDDDTFIDGDDYSENYGDEMMRVELNSRSSSTMSTNNSEGKTRHTILALENDDDTIVLTNIDEIIEKNSKNGSLESREEFAGIVVGTLVVAILFLVAIFVLVFIKKKRYNCISNDECLTRDDPGKSSILVSIPHYLLNPNAPTSTLNNATSSYPTSTILKPSHIETGDVSDEDILRKVTNLTSNYDLYNQLDEDDNDTPIGQTKLQSRPIFSLKMAGTKGSSISGVIVDSLDQRTFGRSSLSKNDLFHLASMNQQASNNRQLNSYETVKPTTATSMAYNSLYSNGTLKNKLQQNRSGALAVSQQYQVFQHHDNVEKTFTSKASSRKQQQPHQQQQQQKKEKRDLAVIQKDKLKIIRNLNCGRFFDTLLCDVTNVSALKYGVLDNAHSNRGYQSATIDKTAGIQEASAGGGGGGGVMMAAAAPHRAVVKVLKKDEMSDNTARCHLESIIRTMSFIQDYNCPSKACSSSSHNNSKSDSCNNSISTNNFSCISNTATTATVTTTTTTDDNNHKNIIKLLGFCKNDFQTVGIVLEHLKYGSLDKVLRRYSSSSSYLTSSPSLFQSTYHYQGSNHGKQLQQSSCCDDCVGGGDDTFDYQCIGTFTPTRKKRGSFAFSYGSLMYLGSQIASGMSHLEKLGIVHGSLSCRSCLVGPNFVVKLSDFAAKHCPQRSDRTKSTASTFAPTSTAATTTTVDISSKDLEDFDPDSTLARIEKDGCSLRWLAWEAAILDKHSHKSDAWSFAVTLWELLTLSRDLPFSNLSEHQLLNRFSCFCRKNSLEQMTDFRKMSTTSAYFKTNISSKSSGRFLDTLAEILAGITLAKPGLCSSETYDLMSVCWSPDPQLRPSFEDIHTFLCQKVSGFRPAPEDANSLMDFLV